MPNGTLQETNAFSLHSICRSFSCLTRRNLKQNRGEGEEDDVDASELRFDSIGYFGDFIILFRDNRTVFSRFAHIELRTINDWCRAAHTRLHAPVECFTSSVFRLLDPTRFSLSIYVHALDQVYSYRIRMNERSNERTTTTTTTTVERVQIIARFKILRYLI